MKKAALAAALALCAGTALAQEVQQGFYAGVSLGGSTTNNCDDIRISVSCKDGVANLKVFAGYQLNRNLAIEAGYTNTLAKTNAESNGGLRVSPFTSETRARAFDLVAVPTLPIGASASLYAKLGLYMASAEEAFAAPNLGTTSRSESNVGGTFGAGFAWSFSRRITARVDWQRFHEVGGDTVATFNVDTLNLGVLYRF